MDELVPIVLDFLKVIVPATFVYIVQVRRVNKERKEKKELKITSKQSKLKLGQIPKIMQLKCIDKVEHSIDTIFRNTRTCRFVVFVGVNGKHDVKNISVLYSKNKNKIEVDQTQAYGSVPTDAWGRKMLKDTERFGFQVIDVFEMPQCQSKSIYYKEGISHSLVEFISRTPIDKDNDFILFCSFATQEEEPYTTTEKLLINSILKESIIPALDELNGCRERSIH